MSKQYKHQIKWNIEDPDFYDQSRFRFYSEPCFIGVIPFYLQYANFGSISLMYFTKFDIKIQFEYEFKIDEDNIQSAVGINHKPTYSYNFNGDTTVIGLWNIKKISNMYGIPIPTADWIKVLNVGLYTNLPMRIKYNLMKKKKWYITQSEMSKLKTNNDILTTDITLGLLTFKIGLNKETKFNISVEYNGDFGVEYVYYLIEFVNIHLNARIISHNLLRIGEEFDNIKLSCIKLNLCESSSWEIGILIYFFFYYF